MARSQPVKVDADTIKSWLTVRRGWKRRGNKLTKDFELESFRDSIVFVNRIASIADHFRHHPDIDIRFGTVTVTLTTHDLGGLTDRDLSVAEQIDFATSAQ